MMTIPSPLEPEDIKKLMEESWKGHGANPFSTEPPPEPEPDYQLIRISNRDFALCRRCSAIVSNPWVHDQFHRSIPTQPCV